MVKADKIKWPPIHPCATKVEAGCLATPRKGPQKLFPAELRRKLPGRSP